MPIANMSSVTGITIHLLAQAKIGKAAAAFRERAAEERLHRAHKNDRGDEQTDHRHRGIARQRARRSL